jgi:hypothetical protein
MKKFDLIREAIKNIIDNSEIGTDPEHSISTHKWVLKLCPNASEELQIAALGHDIERGVNPRVGKKNFGSYEEYKVEHMKRSSEIIGELMRKFDYSEDSVLKVQKLVGKHEIGGNEETDYLMDSDSISYFESNIILYYKRAGFERTKFKIKYMYTRASERAKGCIKNIKYPSEIQKIFDSVLEKEI